MKVSEEKKMILEMLQSGKISTEEAQELLAALDKGVDPAPAEPNSDHQGGNFVEDIIGSIRSGLSNLPLVFDIDSNRIKLEQTLTGQFEAEQVDLDLQTRNGSIRVEAWDEPGYQLDLTLSVRATTREQAEAIVADREFVVRSGNSLMVGDRKSRQLDNKVSVSMRLRLPRQHNYLCQAKTTNGSVEIRELDLSGCQVQSANGSLRLYGINADDVEAKTVNGSLKVEGSMGNLLGKATNGSITIDNIAETSRNELKTVNGRVEVRIPSRENLGIIATAKTTAGSIRMEHPAMKVKEKISKPGNNFLRAATDDEASADIELKLGSVNGSIRISDL